MLNTMQLTMAYFDSKGLKYGTDEKRNVIETGFPLENKGSIRIKIFFDDDDRTVGIRSFDYCAFPDEKKPAMYKACSLANDNYRWIKFSVDEDDNTITLADDAVVQLDSCAEEILELMVRMVHIAGEAYPSFMKALWA